MKTKIFITIFLIVILILVFLFQMKNKNTVSQEIVSIKTEMENEIECENYDDIQTFATPTQIVWYAKLEACVLSCEGGVFTKITSNSQEKYPRFVGYMKDGTIPEQYLKDGTRLKITGEWESIGDDYSRTEFNNKCVPVVNILKIE